MHPAMMIADHKQHVIVTDKGVNTRVATLRSIVEEVQSNPPPKVQAKVTIKVVMEVALRIKIAIKIVTVTRESTVQVVRANTITNPLKNLNAKMIDLVFLSLSCILFLI